MIIGFVGAKQSGKDTAASFLVNSFNFERIQLAGLLKAICKEVFFLNEAQLEGDLKELPDPRYYGWTPRYIMQQVGTETGRLGQFEWAKAQEGALRSAFDRRRLSPKPSLWIDHVIDQLTNVERAVITDVRFQNEASALRSHGAKLVKLHRPASSNSDNHVSEQEYKNILTDLTIVNDGSIKDLNDKVLTIVQEFRLGHSTQSF